MDVDDGIRKAFADRVGAAGPRGPGPGELARALAGGPVRGSRPRLALLGDFAPAIALAAASLILALAPPERVLAARPLAAELSAGGVAEAFGGLADIVFEAGEWYRSKDGR